MNDYDLYHFGIKGMKWGVRRYQNKDGSLTPAGKKRQERYEKTAQSLTTDRAKRYVRGKDARRNIDEAHFGKKGVERIARRMDKGDPYQAAVGKQAIGNLAKVSAGLAIGGLAYSVLTSKSAGKAMQKAISLGKSAVDSYYNVQVLSKTGEVITRYHSKISTGKAVVDGLMKIRR